MVAAGCPVALGLTMGASGKRPCHPGSPNTRVEPQPLTGNSSIDGKHLQPHKHVELIHRVHTCFLFTLLCGKCCRSTPCSLEATHLDSTNMKVQCNQAGVPSSEQPSGRSHRGNAWPPWSLSGPWLNSLKSKPPPFFFLPTAECVRIPIRFPPASVDLLERPGQERLRAEASDVCKVIPLISHNSNNRSMSVAALWFLLSDLCPSKTGRKIFKLWHW